MYSYVKPKPLTISLYGSAGLELRKKAVEFVEKVRIKGAEAGNEQEQTYGILAQMVIRKELGLPLEPDENQDKGFDLLLQSGIKVDIKCRGGSLPFQELYIGSGGIKREAKHNFFARQVWDTRLDADIYLMTHLETPKPKKGQKTALPGTEKQRKWNLYICGWVSKERVKKEGIYLPRGAITEQGKKWFPYKAHEIEFYHQHLNGLSNIKDIPQIDKADVVADEKKAMGLHLTSVDAMRIAIDLIGHGVLKQDVVEFLKESLEIKERIPPILHSNQYYHLLKWLKDKNKIDENDLRKLTEIMEEGAYKG